MSYPRYGEYRDSRVEWLGEIPAHWDTDRLKWSAKGCKNGIWGSEPDGDDDLVCIRVADFDRRSFKVDTEQLTLRSIRPKDRNGRVLAKGDLLIEKSGGGEKQPVGAVVYFDHDFDAVSSNFIARMPIVENMDGRFWSYVHAHLYSSRVNTRSIKQTTGIQNLDSQQYLDESIAYPPLPEQQAIARFLDHKTAQIDELIAKKEALLAKLAEKRTALISQAVTKGLDPDAPMKDSGIEWLGEIPAHWIACKTKYVADLRSGHTPSRQHPEYWEDCSIPWFSLADVWQLRDGRREYLGETKELISKLGLNNSAAQLLPAGTVVVSRTASVGYSGIMPEPMATTQDFVNWVCGPAIMPLYLLYVFRSMGPEFRRLIMGSTHQTIYMPDAAAFDTPVPPISEQREIVDYIQNQKKKYDDLEDKIVSAIAFLRERRTSLITHAVTGQIDVRDLAPLEPSS